MKTRKEKDKDIRVSDMSTERGMHNSKHQGGREFDREKEDDHFERSDRREELEEKIHASGQGTAFGGGSTEGRTKTGGSPYYSGSQQDKSTPGQHPREGRDL